MQEQVNDKTVTLVVKGTKLTGRLLAKAISKLLAEMKKQNGPTKTYKKNKKRHRRGGHTGQPACRIPCGNVYPAFR